MLEFLKAINWKEVAAPLLEYLLAAIVVYAVVPNLGKIPSATGKFFEWLKDKASHTKNQYFAGVLMRASIVIRDHVLELENTEIELLKEKVAKGEIKKEDLPKLLAEVKQKAIDAAKEHMKATDLMKDVLSIFMGNENALVKWLGDQVETHVSTLPASGLQTSKDGETPPAVLVAPAIPR